jgi:NosR/NirI family transcriptional regulator, nitrous oxide reductase regulator
MRGTVIAILALLVLAAPLLGEDRVERFPAPDFRSGYKMPVTQTPPGPAAIWQVVDVLALATALSLAAWFVFRRRSRTWVFALTVACVVYFGFWRKGCVCPVGSIQNVAYAAGGNGYALPWMVAAFFLLPLLFTLFYGRVFCAGVCPLGAVQDLVLIRPVRVPTWIELPLGLLAWVYFGLAVLFASIGSDFVVCRYDPFVGFFRLSGPTHMIVAGGLLLAIGVFVGRPYCRFLCPYSIPLRLLAPFSSRKVSITPSHCIDCRLCEASCPFGAIRFPSPLRTGSPQPDIQRRRGGLTLLATGALVVLFAFAGYLASGAMSRADVTVRLAAAVSRDEVSDATRAFRSTGQSPQSLYSAAASIQRRFSIAAPIFGAWMGLAIGSTVFRLIIPRRRTGYTADSGTCLACARCFASCPAQAEDAHRRRELVAV